MYLVVALQLLYTCTIWSDLSSRVGKYTNVHGIWDGKSVLFNDMSLFQDVLIREVPLYLHVCTCTNKTHTVVLAHKHNSIRAGYILCTKNADNSVQVYYTLHHMSTT